MQARPLNMDFVDARNPCSSAGGGVWVVRGMGSAESPPIFCLFQGHYVLQPLLFHLPLLRSPVCSCPLLDWEPTRSLFSHLMGSNSSQSSVKGILFRQHHLRMEEISCWEVLYMWCVCACGGKWMFKCVWGEVEQTPEVWGPLRSVTLTLPPAVQPRKAFWVSHLWGPFTVMTPV